MAERPSDELLGSFKAAMEHHDLDGLLATLSPAVVLRSPISRRVVFKGDRELRELMAIHFATVRNVRYLEDELVYTGLVRGRPIEVVNRLSADHDGLVAEIVVYVRPLPGLAAMAAALGPPLARSRRSRLHALVMRAGLEPLLALASAGDRLATYLV